MKCCKCGRQDPLFEFKSQAHQNIIGQLEQAVTREKTTLLALLPAEPTLSLLELRVQRLRGRVQAAKTRVSKYLSAKAFLEELLYSYRQEAFDWLEEQACRMQHMQTQLLQRTVKQQELRRQLFQVLVRQAKEGAESRILPQILQQKAEDLYIFYQDCEVKEVSLAYDYRNKMRTEQLNSFYLKEMLRIVRCLNLLAAIVGVALPFRIDQGGTWSSDYPLLRPAKACYEDETMERQEFNLALLPYLQANLYLLLKRAGTGVDISRVRALVLPLQQVSLSWERGWQRRQIQFRLPSPARQDRPQRVEELQFQILEDQFLNS